MSWKKDPAEVLDYAVDWPKRLAGDTIVSSTWIIPPAITSPSNSFDPDETVIWLAGGDLGDTYHLINEVETTGGRTMRWSTNLIMLER
jgi:hypothetical protein